MRLLYTFLHLCIQQKTFRVRYDENFIYNFSDILFHKRYQPGNDGSVRNVWKIGDYNVTLSDEFLYTAEKIVPPDDPFQFEQKLYNRKRGLLLRLSEPV